MYLLTAPWNWSLASCHRYAIFFILILSLGTANLKQFPGVQMFIKPAKRPKPSENLTKTVMRGTEQSTNNNTNVSGVVFLHLYF